MWKSAWPSSLGGSKSALSQQARGKDAGIITIGGTGRKGGGGTNHTLKSQSSQWNRLAESDDEPLQSRDDLELVPKHLRGHVEVTVHASPRAARRSEEERKAQRHGSNDGGMDDDFQMDGIRQRTDVEWRVEERGAS